MRTMRLLKFSEFVNESANNFLNVYDVQDTWWTLWSEENKLNFSSPYIVKTMEDIRGVEVGDSLPLRISPFWNCIR